MIKQVNRIRALASRRADDESGVALLTAILFMILMAGISTVLVSVVLSQLLPTNLAQKSTKTIYAAQAGMQTALGLIRSATGGGGVGDLTKLPCSATGDASGTASDAVTYSAQISYFTADPTSQTAAWLTSNKLACTASGVATQPKFAMVVSQGLAPAIPGGSATTVGNRTLSAIYKFRITTVNVPGGRIYDFNAAYCMRAVSSTVGSLVQFMPVAQCTNDVLELWVYGPDWQLKLASSRAGGAAGLCITGPVTYGGGQQNATLQTCRAGTDPNRWNQLWSWFGINTWLGQNQTIAAGQSTACLDSGYANGTNLTNKYLLITTSCIGDFSPSSEVGAGAAGKNTNEIVNYQEFGRCIDVTAENVNAAFEQVYPCKQDPTGTGNQIRWNQKWYYTEPVAPATTVADQQIYLLLDDDAAKKYCLTTPTQGSGTFYPTLKTCVPGSATQKWARVADAGTYAASWLFTDTYGRCLDADPSSLNDGLYSKITVATCDSTFAQKWNAKPFTSDSTVATFKEISP